MTVRELFDCLNTDAPRILIYNNDNEVIYNKLSSKPIGKLQYFNNSVAWIYRADSTEIALRIE